MIDNLLLGFKISLSFYNIIYCFIGCVLGTIIGVLPGLGPTATIAMLLTLTYKLDITSAVIMLSGIYYGAQYGGTITSVLFRIPGEASTVVIRSEIAARNLQEFCQGLNNVGLDSTYYHFFEARWRLGRPIDDFSYWIETNFGLPKLVAAIRDMDIYFYNLKEIRNTLLGLIHQYLGDICDQPQ